MLVAVVRVAFGVALGDFGVESLLLLGREQGAYARARVLPEPVIARSHFTTQRAIFVTCLIQYGAYLGRLLLVQAEVALHVFKHDLFVAPAALLFLTLRVARPQAIYAVKRCPGQAAQRKHTDDHQPYFE